MLGQTISISSSSVSSVSTPPSSEVNSPRDIPVEYASDEANDEKLEDQIPQDIQSLKHQVKNQNKGGKPSKNSLVQRQFDRDLDFVQQFESLLMKLNEETESEDQSKSKKNDTSANNNTFVNSNSQLMTQMVKLVFKDIPTDKQIQKLQKNTENLQSQKETEFQDILSLMQTKQNELESLVTMQALSSYKVPEQQVEVKFGKRRAKDKPSKKFDETGKCGRWSAAEIQILQDAVKKYGENDWKQVQQEVKTRNEHQCQLKYKGLQNQQQSQ